MQAVSTYPRWAAPSARVEPAPLLVPFSAAVALGFLSMFFTGNWATFPAVLLLWAAWRYLRTEEGPPVFSLALTHHWLQISIGLFYYPICGRTSRFGTDDPNVICGHALLAFGLLIAGVAVGLRWQRPAPGALAGRPDAFFHEPIAILLYFAFVFGTTVLHAFANENPGIMQLALAFGYLRLAFLYLLLRRYVAQARWWAFLAIGGAEILFGFTSYFAGFREGFVIMFLSLIERFDRRQTLHWVLVVATASAAIGAGMVWTSVKGKLRRDIDVGLATTPIDRLARVLELTFESTEKASEEFFPNADKLVDRQWPVYIPHLAFRRVGRDVPFADGAILMGALQHVSQPRIIFPDKAELMSDSDKVRRYSGLWVAGAESNTSIAFGYLAESYVDWGVPLMYGPILGFGIFMGAAYRVVMRWIWHRELAIAISTVVFWAGTYLFERSWDRMLGIGLTYLIVMTVAAIVMERLFGRIPQRTSGP